MSNVNRITICSVYFNSYHKKLLELNIKTTKKLNPNIIQKWIVVNNSIQKKITNIKLKDVETITGVKYPHHIPNFYQASYHHAEAINKSLKKVKTRYILILDCDFYIIQPDILSSILSYIKENNLSLLGVTWHPKWYIKYRYFPSIHCLFIDTKKVKKSQLDFRPSYNTKNKRIKKINFIFSLLLTFLFQKRNLIGQSKDTGYRIYQKLNKHKNIYQIIQPVFNNKNIEAKKYLKNPISRIIEKILPDKWSFIPKRKESYSVNGFKEYGLKDISKYNFEEFIWEGKPFGFHLRGWARTNNIDNINYLGFKKNLKILINQSIKKYKHAKG